MAHLLYRLNRDIQDVVELYHYTSIEDLVHQATICPKVASSSASCVWAKGTLPSNAPTREFQLARYPSEEQFEGFFTCYVSYVQDIY
ncbi:hypothetical protein CR513_40421, partial [Mucuna pruriens]